MILKEGRPGLAVIAPAKGPVIVASAAFQADMFSSGFQRNNLAKWSLSQAKLSGQLLHLVAIDLPINAARDLHHKALGLRSRSAFKVLGYLKQFDNLIFNLAAFILIFSVFSEFFCYFSANENVVVCGVTRGTR